MSTIDTTVRDHQTPDSVQEQPPRDRSGRTGVLIGVPVAVLGAVAATFALATTSSDRPAGPVTNPPAAYQPGGSVYGQQVPDFLDRGTGYGPGSSLYDAQVPQPGPRP